jgi:aminobenzoyl-glutamate utilization protein B
MRNPTPFRLLLLCLLIPVGHLYGQKAKPLSALQKQAIRDLDPQQDAYRQIARQIWDYAEPGFKEVKSSGLLQKTLADNGFTVQAGVAGMPTAFVASYGSGTPVVGILAEFDALAGLAQQAVPERKALAGQEAGHACGHHLLGTGAVAAGIALKGLIASNKLKGTVKVFGCPAEEVGRLAGSGNGKVFMVREGVFRDVDAIMHWHPYSTNHTQMKKLIANVGVKFRFRGTAAHASVAPEKGRSALDAVEAMNHMVNLMREHMPSDARVHYSITDGGKAPNVVPDFAEVHYLIRHLDTEVARQLLDRVVKAAEGAALGTETKVEYEITNGVYNLLLNKTLALAMQQNLERVGGVRYTPEETEFAQKIQATLPGKLPDISTAALVEPLEEVNFAGSTDVGDVSWNVPTVGVDAATWVPGTTPHTWQAVACGATDIGMKGMMVAAKALTLMGIDLFTNPTLLQKAREEFNQVRGKDFAYKPIIGDARPAVK